MRVKIFISIILLSLSPAIIAQRTDTPHIRVVDTLSAKEKSSRIPVILKTELDSLIKVYNATQVQQFIKEPDKEKNNSSNQYLLAGLVIVIGLLGFVIVLFYNQKKIINKLLADFIKRVKSQGTENGLPVEVREKKGKTSQQILENKIADLNAEIHKLSKENDSLNRVVKEYNGIQHVYDSLKHGMLKAYKVKNYPGYDKNRSESSAIQNVLDTENTVANYAYEKFLKPLLAITDANKNSPAKLNDTDRNRLLDLLVSLSFLYIEYLYLRVNDLSIGGKMVERIKSLAGSNGIDNSLLRKLDTEFGSRALVIKMALSKTGMQKLSYPVFDETNLNN
ncbi:MAG: hypothetical protein HZB42_03165 [Sphingobacteriales bacterium]|nr:hypothetical protein [Sphingobacteriales bacterium]